MLGHLHAVWEGRHRWPAIMRGRREGHLDTSASIKIERAPSTHIWCSGGGRGD